MVWQTLSILDLEPLKHLNLATFLRVPNLSALESFSSHMLTQVKILVHIANIPVHCLFLAPQSFRCLIFGAQHLTGPVDRIFLKLNIHVIFLAIVICYKAHAFLCLPPHSDRQDIPQLKQLFYLIIHSLLNVKALQREIEGYGQSSFQIHF